MECSDIAPISNETTVIGNITSVGLIEESVRCPKCHSHDIENNEKTIKCLACKTRTIKAAQKVDSNRIRLNVADMNGNTFDVIGETTKIQTLLDQSNHGELSDANLIENEQVLLILSTLDVRIRFNSRSKYLIEITTNIMVSKLIQTEQNETMKYFKDVDTPNVVERI